MAQCTLGSGFQSQLSQPSAPAITSRCSPCSGPCSTDDRPESDVDLLVEFEPAHQPGLLALAGMEAELTALMGRHVDLRTPTDLSRYFRDAVMTSAEVQFAR